MINELLNQAKKAGACARTENITTWPELAKLYYSPQGREFCRKHNLPDIETWRRAKLTSGYHLQRQAVHVDQDEVLHIMQGGCIALIGHTHGKIICNGNTDICRIILQHGATATIKATNYAVVEVLEYSNDSHADIQADNTTILL